MEDEMTNMPVEGEEAKCTCSETCPDDCNCEKCGCGKGEATESAEETAEEAVTPAETETTEEATE